jgi:hypothetical protein
LKANDPEREGRDHSPCRDGLLSIFTAVDLASTERCGRAPESGRKSDGLGLGPTDIKAGLRAMCGDSFEEIDYFGLLLEEAAVVVINVCERYFAPHAITFKRLPRTAEAIPARPPAAGSSWPTITQRRHGCGRRRRARDPHSSAGRELNLDCAAGPGGRRQRLPVWRRDRHQTKTIQSFSAVVCRRRRSSPRNERTEEGLKSR